MDNKNRLAAFISYLEDGLSEEQAAEKVSKFYVRYGYPKDEEIDDVNKPLPPELKDRVNTYICNISMGGLDKAQLFRQRLETASSINSVIREEIKKGVI